MGFLDDMLGLPAGTLDSAATDIIGPAYTAAGQYAQDIYGMAPTTVAGAGGSVGGGATGDWSGALSSLQSAGILGGSMPDYSVGFPAGLALSGPRRVLPYAGGIIPSGYRVANRAARRPTSGYPAGTYLVPRRRMNPLNPHALMRAERRMASFTHWVKRHFRIAGAMPHRKRKAKCSYRRKKR